MGTRGKGGELGQLRWAMEIKPHVLCIVLASRRDDARCGHSPRARWALRYAVCVSMGSPR